MEEGYRAMAADEMREAEALEWSEEMILDVADEMALARDWIPQ
jgi:hypothetical protein